MRLIYLKNSDINDELVKRYFLIPNLRDLLEKMKELKNNPEKNRIQVDLIKTGLSNLKKEIKKMSEDEIKIEKPYKIVDIVEKILKFNRQQQGKRLKILTPNQMLSRLQISLAQLKAGNNSEKLKNEIRQILYSLYRSKKLTKQIYESLIDII